MLINFYWICKTINCKEFIYFKIPREAFHPINCECILSDKMLMLRYETK